MHLRLRKWSVRSMVVFIGFFVLTTISQQRGFTPPQMVEKFLAGSPWYLLVPLAALLAILNVPRMFTRNQDGWAFLFSCLCIFLLLCVYGIGTFPNLVRSTIDPDQNSLTFYNSASSTLTLKVLLIIVVIGIPMVLAYGAIIYRIFRGKVKIGGILVINDKNDYDDLTQRRISHEDAKIFINLFQFSSRLRVVASLR